MKSGRIPSLEEQVQGSRKRERSDAHAQPVALAWQVLPECVEYHKSQQGQQQHAHRKRCLRGAGQWL